MKSTPGHGPQAADTSPGKGRLWLLRLLTVVLIPAFFLGLLEGGLRLAGVGYPTGFFASRTIEGEEVLLTNHRFTFRFFPQALARTMIPHRIEADKPEDTYRIFIFGESAANGDPDPAYGFGRHLEILLEERFPETDFEIVNTGITAINSHVILPIARDCAGADGDLWIVYMGNNEFIGPYGPGTVFGSKAPPVAGVRASLALKSTRIGQLLDNLRQNLGRNGEAPETWGGINMFAENPLADDDPGRLRAYENFRVNLNDLLTTAESADVPVLLSTMAVNLRDCAPFASLHDEALTESAKAEWQRLFDRGKTLEEEKAYRAALDHYRQAATIDPGYAEGQYRLGRLYALKGDTAAALEALTRARDADAVAVRADSRINRILREAAEDRASTSLVDAAEALRTHARGGLPGRGLFYEHVHFTVPAHYHLARIFAEKVVERLPAGVTASDRGEWVPAVTCQRKLAVTLWDRHRIWTDLAEQLANPPFTARSNNPAERAFARASAEQAKQRIRPDLDRKIYESALRENPDDSYLRERFGRYLLQHKQFSEAIPHFRWITERFPGYEGGHQDLGLALLLDRQFEKAEKSFLRVLAIRPAYPRARKALQLIRENPDDLPDLP